ncbi:hypothetical protein Pnap_1264 [Polaromonas naphthalenivorans CJ2]|uniref:Uncharacterized protein n=1 Tax=Polaromonas naphthalenivorans (strain CJ2) TaxID=365044 RepID=A1VLQ1_POLNA|nr:hypothetical protein Pnap_1264 [Polaromonas naphthalenivorans CJ2]
MGGKPAFEKTVPQASTGPVRAWESGNGWLVAGCRFGAGEAGGFGVGSGARIENRGCIHGRRGQREAVARLAGVAGLAMPVRDRRLAISRVPGAVVRRLCGIGRCRHCRFMVKIGFCAYRMRVSSYCFYSGLLGCLGRVPVLQRSQRHVVGHRIARPAAKKQQGGHEDEEQGAHG